MSIERARHRSSGDRAQDRPSQRDYRLLKNTSITQAGRFRDGLLAIIVLASGGAMLSAAVGPKPASDIKAAHKLNPSGDNASPPDSSATKEFSPGVHINWQRRLVELDATVVLRRGPLELLVCSPGTREHESILTVSGRPRDIFHALGLMGFDPGTPARYDEKLERTVPPIGEALRLDIRYRRGGVDRTVPASSWLLDVKARRPPESIDWVLAGSGTLGDGRFGADVDGTVVCVVDFATALIAVGETHSADNRLLWLEANMKEIPPVGTRCTLIIQATENVCEVALAADGTLTYLGGTVSAKEVARLVRNSGPGKPGNSLILSIAPGTTDAALAAVLESLATAGVDRPRITVIGPPSELPRPGQPKRTPDG